MFIIPTQKVIVPYVLWKPFGYFNRIQVASMISLIKNWLASFVMIKVWNFLLATRDFWFLKICLQFVFVAHLLWREPIQFVWSLFHFKFLNFREELVKECLQRGTELVQAIADRLFNLPSTEDIDGPLVKLPPPVTRLPREKHVSCLFILYYII